MTPASLVEDTELVELAPESREWLAFAGSQPQATVFHHPAWIGLLAACYGYPSSILALISGGDLVAGLPVLAVRRPFGGSRLVSLPFTDHCPALASDDHWRRALAEAVVDWSRGHGRVVEVRGELDAVSGVARSRAGFRHLLPLAADPEALIGRFDRNVRSRLGKGPRLGLDARVGVSARERDAFYQLHLQTRMRLGVPIQPRRFFDALWERLLGQGLGFAVVAWRGGTPVAAAVFLAWNGTLIYKYSASDRDHWRLAPNHLVLWTAIRRACETGCSTFDFGRTELPNAGLRTFKSEWGGTEVELVTSTVGGAAASRPEGAASRLLSSVIRHSPSLACRAAGELLYRYFP